MRILVACEFSGAVRDAFAALGHDAWSCDLLPTENPGQHIQGDVLEVLNDGWDLMIAHPPCQYLTVASNRLWHLPERASLRRRAALFFYKLYTAPIPQICVENPVGWMNSHFRKPDQIVHPYYFGDRDMKKTCLWLKGLQPLWFWEADDLFGKRTMTDHPEPLYVHERKPSQYYKGGEIKKRYFVDHKGSKSGHERSRTFPSVAAAMAAQWGKFEIKDSSA